MQSITPQNAPDVSAFPLSHGIVDGDFIFTSGQIPMTPDGTLVEGSMLEKTKQVMANIQAILAEAGASLADVVKVTVYITNFDEYAEFNQQYATYFAQPYPVREVVGVKDLPAGASLEISMIAKKPKSTA